MQSLENIKTKGQEGWSTLVERGKSRPEEVKTWGATAGGAVVGAVAVTAVAKGIVAVVSTLAAPPMAFTIGALGGGALGWTYIRKQQEASKTDAPAAPAADPSPTSAPLASNRVQDPLTTAATAGAPGEPDNLEAVSGIGPIYAARLREAGVSTFAQLAALTPERIEEIIAPIRSGHMIDADSWIAEARQLDPDAGATVAQNPPETAQNPEEGAGEHTEA